MFYYSRCKHISSQSLIWGIIDLKIKKIVGNFVPLHPLFSSTQEAASGVNEIFCKTKFFLFHSPKIEGPSCSFSLFESDVYILYGVWYIYYIYIYIYMYMYIDICDMYKYHTYKYIYIYIYIHMVFILRWWIPFVSTHSATLMWLPQQDFD